RKELHMSSTTRWLPRRLLTVALATVVAVGVTAVATQAAYAEALNPANLLPGTITVQKDPTTGRPIDVQINGGRPTGVQASQRNAINKDDPLTGNFASTGTLRTATSTPSPADNPIHLTGNAASTASTWQAALNRPSIWPVGTTLWFLVICDATQQTLTSP